MRYLLGFLCVCALGVAPLVGCGETEGDPGGSGGSAGIGGNGGTGGTEVRVYQLEFTELKADGFPGFLEGVEACEVDTGNCVTSNELGRADLEVAANQEVTIAMKKDGYGPLVTGDVSDETFGPEGGTGAWPVDWRMYTDAQLAVIAEQLQTPYPWEGGIVGLLKWVSPNTGVTFAPVGSTIGEVGEAFYFDAATEQYSLDPEATTGFSGLWNYPLAEGGFTEVTPGEQQFEFGGTAGDCSVSWGWPVDGAPNRIRVPVLEGYATYGSMVCDEQ